MTSTPTIVNEVESYLRNWVAEVSKLRDKECLCCYVARMLDEFPCDGSLRHALHYRDAIAPRATALARRLGNLGGYCDCEIFLNGYQLVDAGAGADDAADADAYWDAALAPDAEAAGHATAEELPPCQGVRRGTVTPCGNWVRLRR